MNCEIMVVVAKRGVAGRGRGQVNWRHWIEASQSGMVKGEKAEEEGTGHTGNWQLRQPAQVGRSEARWVGIASDRRVDVTSCTMPSMIQQRMRQERRASEACIIPMTGSLSCAGKTQSRGRVGNVRQRTGRASR